MKHIARLFFVMAFMSLALTARAQLVVNGKNLNDDKELTYIQLMYTIDRGSLKPVFFVDYGFIEPEYNDIIKPSKDGSGQKISINGENISDRVTVVWVLNKLHKAGWEYIGDVIYVPVPMMDNWHVFTLRRRTN
jgi:hypothetical protein